MEILTAAEMAAADQRSVDGGVPVAALMERAGEAVARFCLRRYPTVRRVAVLCGKGNNGGDGFVAARVLREAGWDVRVVLLGVASDVKGEAAEALLRVGSRLLQAGSIAVVPDALGDVDLVVDAVVGTGFKPPLRGLGGRGAGFARGDDGAGGRGGFAEWVGCGFSCRKRCGGLSGRVRW